MHASESMTKYFEKIELDIKEAFKLASKARKKGYDCKHIVEITHAKDMAERVIGLISVVAPQIKDSKAKERIIELEKEYGILDWRVALQIALDIATQKICKFKTEQEAIEVGIRTGFAYGTVGVVSSPLEGFVRLDIKKRNDGKDYFAINFSGPIRNAGGTAASWCVIIADYVRVNMGYFEYDPDQSEIKRTFTEVSNYHERVTNLQYFPSQAECEFLTQNCPIEITGDPTEKINVSNFKDLKRVPTNRIRGGFCLVNSECIPSKCEKIWKNLSKWCEDFKLSHWVFLETLSQIKKKAHSGLEKNNGKILPNYTFISEIVAGRPILGYPMRKGGFRLRYGRSRYSGYSGQSINPATMIVLNDYIAIGTQLKTERPGKGTTFTTCDKIQGPIVKLNDDSVLFLNDVKTAKSVVNEIKEIIFIGDLLINYGDFFDRAHPLVPAGYCEEWWVQELEKEIVTMFGSLDLDKTSDTSGVNLTFLENLIKKPLDTKITAKDAILLSQNIKVPLHPYYTYHWSDIDLEQTKKLLNWLITAKKSEDKLILENSKIKRILELIGCPHSVKDDNVIINIEHSHIMTNIIEGYNSDNEYLSVKSSLELINTISKITIKDKSGTYIGARMGRPEKAKMRKMLGSTHSLFPFGEDSGRLRTLQSVLDSGKITGDFPIYNCEKCVRHTIYEKCEKCNSETKKMYFCNTCGVIDTKICKTHGVTSTYTTQDLDIKHYFEIASKKVGGEIPEQVKGIRKLSNKNCIPENLIKGILRARNKLFVNKDGTVRYDATESPCTHFKPKEIQIDIEKIIELGYNTDIFGKPLTDPNQILELKCQDVILPACTVSPDEPSDNVLFRITKFMDELLKKLYKIKPFYNLSEPKDLVGHYIVGLAPHTSAGMVGRIIGFSKTQCFFAHPYYHAAVRRDTDGDEIGFMMLMDALINFSRDYLPTHRGSNMDAPIVLTSILNPSEVDDMVFNMDIVWKYPIELYEAALEYKKPYEINIKKVQDVLDTELQYEKMGFTHSTDNINTGILCSAYKTLPSMSEKLDGQMLIAKKLRSVNESDVARLVIEKHFLKDTAGNLRKFSMQQFRCVKCNKKYRRPPLIGKCLECKGKIIFTIPHGSVIKYLEPSKKLAKDYNLPVYLKQTLELLQRRVHGVFGTEPKDNQ